MYKCEQYCRRGAATDGTVLDSTRTEAAWRGISAHLPQGLTQAATMILVTVRCCV